MTGKMYNSSEDAKNAFQSKDLLDKIITLNEDNPTISDLDSCYELYKLFWMANYLMWENFRFILIDKFDPDVPDRIRHNSYLCFRINVVTTPFDTLIWLAETNAPQHSASSIIDMLAQKQHTMVEKYKAQHGVKALDRLSQTIAGTLNRHMPLFMDSLEGEWLSPNHQGGYWPLDYWDPCDEIPTKLDVNKPFYSLIFQKGDRCIFGGSSERALQISGHYDSRYNVIFRDDTGEVAAFVVSLKNDTLDIIHRYYVDPDSKKLRKCEDDNLVIEENKRKTDLMKELRPGRDY